MKIVGIIQARNGSNRLPDKSLYPLNGMPLLYRFIERVLRSQNLTDVILGTTDRYEDVSLMELADMQGIKSYAGNENDLIRRIYMCALTTEADLIVRLCADNPLIEPQEIDRIIQFAVNEMEESRENRGFMYSNTHNIDGNGYPDGLGAEVYHIDLFQKMHNDITDVTQREHPHQFCYENGLVRTIPCPEHLRGYEHLKLDVNTADEYGYIRGIYDKFDGNNFKFEDYKDLI